MLKENKPEAPAYVAPKITILHNIFEILNENGISEHEF